MEPEPGKKLVEEVQTICKLLSVKSYFCFLTHLTHALTAATEWLNCTKEMVSKHYSSFLHRVRNWDRRVQKYVFYEAVLSITRVNPPRAAYSDSVGLYLSSRNYFEVNGPNRIHFLFAIRLWSKFSAKDWKRGYEQRRRSKKLDMRCSKHGWKCNLVPVKNQDFCAKRQLCHNHNCIGGHSWFFCLSNQNCVTVRTIKMTTSFIVTQD